MRRRRFVTLVGLGLVTPLAGCAGQQGGGSDGTTTTERPMSEQTGQTTGTSAPTKTQTPSGTPKAEVKNAKLVDEPTGYGSTDYYMTGTVENTGSARLRLPSVSIKFYDDEESVLSSTEREIFSLKPGQTWDVRAMFTETDSKPAKGSMELGELEVGFENYSHPSSVKLSDTTFEEGKDPSITGSIENTSKQSIDVYAFGQFLTEKKVVLGTGTDSITDLSAGESWAFDIKSIFTDEKRAQKAKRYEIYLSTP